MRLTELGDGSYFGELPFTHQDTIKLQPMSAVVEKKVCEYHILSAAHVNELFNHFPEVELGFSSLTARVRCREILSLHHLKLNRT